MKKKEELDIKQINETVKLSRKILDLLYIGLIVTVIFVGVLLIRETGIIDFCLTILKVITPLFVGFAIAWLLDPLVRKLIAKGLNRTLSSVIVFTIFLGIILSFFGFLFPVIYEQLNDLIKVIPDVAIYLEDFVNNIFDNLNTIEGLDVEVIKDNIFSSATDIFTSITNSLPTTILNIVRATFSGLGIILISLVVALYMLVDFDDTSGHLVKFLPAKNRFEIKSLLDTIGIEIRRTVNGIATVAFIVFVATSIGFWGTGLKAPLLFGMFCGITNIIPYIGPYIGGSAALLVAFSQGPVIGIMTFLVIFAVQLAENMILQPMVMSKTMKLHPVTIIIGLLIFGQFFGILGMILATPAMALIKVVLQFIQQKFNLFAN